MRIIWVILSPGQVRRTVASTDDEVVLYEVSGAVAHVIMNRPKYRNAQNSRMTYALDSAFYRAAEDPAVRVVVLSGAGKHFSAGHDIGTPERDLDVGYDRKASLWWSHLGEEGASARYAREQEVYLGMCRRWRELPKPLIAQVHGACIAGGLMLAWICDLIVASDDAFFCDPVLRMGIPGVEYFAHPWVMGPRFAKEFLFLGQTVDAKRAYELGMVNRVVPREELSSEVDRIASAIADMPRLGLALAKRAINQCEDEMGLRNGMEAAFGLHHLAHAHNAEVNGDSVAGQNVASMKEGRERSAQN
jgi:enoyl-CoA hydratase